MTDTTILDVGMTCEGCAGAVKRILGKVEGVSSVETNVDEKKVTVVSEGIEKEELVKKLSKWSEASGKYVKLAA
eukprot:CAMPEP_0203669078 /NCGR_PEP_ID=MMETSP0090-20130426/5545_1 /ASSEMBLY_ACC=CAM_ASM_001088 /TAXON_ID=426623 /ORGANISM="Chaetoceros affinis, Strain CCMP159" /LENGTH=73 /DNA_ID=CAMNT_0050533673 /DNA_START=104 /DNA_END=325 /DNA_ORIENTATION=-